MAGFILIGTMETELVNFIAAIQWRRRRVNSFEVAAAVATPDADPAQPPRLGWIDTSELKVLRRELEDREAVLRDARRRAPLVLALATGGDGDRMQPDDATFLLDQAADVVQVHLPVPTTTFDADGNLQLSGAWPEVDGHDPELLAGVGVPAEFHDAPPKWDGWTVDLVRKAFAALSTVAYWSVEQIMRELSKADIARLEKRVLKARVEQLAAAATGDKAIPPDAALEPILRYEPHLSRQLSQALDQLQQVWALRRR